MKKRLLLIVALLLMFAPQSEAKKGLTVLAPSDSAGTALTDYSLTSGSAVFSDTIDVSRNVGFITLVVTEDKSGGAGDVDISAEYSLDGTNWNTVYESDMAGVITADGNIVTGLQNATRWIVFQARLGQFLRLKLDPAADSEVTVQLIFQEEPQ